MATMQTQLTLPQLSETLHPVIAEDVRRVIARTPALELLDGRTVLITGGGGLLASYLVYTVVELNASYLSRPCTIVVTTRRPPADYPRLRPLLDRPDMEWCQADSAVLAPPVEREFDYVIHAACPASAGGYLADPLGTARANSLGLLALLELARRVQIEGMLFVSSGQVYGSPPPEHVPTPEDYVGRVDPLAQRSCYDESKRFGETLCAVYARQYGVPVRIVRPVQVYGPGIDPHDDRAFAEFAWSAARGEPLMVRSDGKDRRSYCYLADAAVMLWHVLLHGEAGQAYNVGCCEPLVTIRTLAETIARMAEPPAPVVHHSQQVGSRGTGAPRVSCPDIQKVTQLVGAPPEMGLEQGFGRVYSWARDSLRQKGPLA
jgi:nucleoside-diphosphate-sugar epimerase